MSRRVQVKQLKKVIGNDSDGGNINSMFEEMMGMKDCEPDIIRPKLVKIRNTVRHIYKVLIQFSTFVPLQSDFPNIIPHMQEIKDFAENMKKALVLGDTDETEEQYTNMDKSVLNSTYNTLKDHEYVRRLIVLCGKLKHHHKNFDDLENLKLNFVGQEPGLSFKIFDFSNLDLKILWADTNMKTMQKKYILTILHTLYKDLFQLYRTSTSPNVDIDKFVTLLLDSIGQLKKQPGLDRCRNAFKRIEQSVELLKERFEDYYRESIASENPNMIVESFIVDVSNQGGADARLTREFRQIIQYMHKVSNQNGRIKDPNVQKLFAMLNKNFSAMEEKTAKASTKSDSSTKLEDLDFDTKPE